jgi:hypothetical protein
VSEGKREESGSGLTTVCLSIGYNKIGPEGCKELVQALQDNTTLRSLE